MPFKLFEVSKDIPERKEHTYVKHCDDPADCLPKCNIKTIPGSMTERGCAFAGAKGVITGALKDVAHIVHSPVGCTVYGYGTKRYPTTTTMPDGSEFPIKDFNIKYIIGTDLQESDVVFGGIKKLRQAIRDTNKEFPFVSAIYLYATCTTGLIGDDMDGLAKEMEEEIGKPIIAFNAPGFAGPSQSKGHTIGNNVLFSQLVGTAEPPKTTPYDINLIGEYNIDGDLWLLKDYFKEIGINCLTTFTGDSSHHEISWMHRAKLSVVRCQRSSTYIAQMIEDKYGIPYIKTDFFSTQYCAKNLKQVARFFGLEEKADQVIANRMAKVGPELEFYRKKLTGKKAFIFSGGPKSYHISIPIEQELGMETTGVSSMFEHEDGFQKMKDRVKEGALVIDDPNTIELEELVEDYDIDLIMCGVKEKYLIHKLGIPSLLIHSYENGPYIGFEGFLNLARDMYSAIYNPVWNFLEFQETEEPDIVDPTQELETTAIEEAK